MVNLIIIFSLNFKPQITNLNFRRTLLTLKMEAVTTFN